MSARLGLIRSFAALGSLLTVSGCVVAQQPGYGYGSADGYAPQQGYYPQQPQIYAPPPVVIYGAPQGYRVPFGGVQENGKTCTKFLFGCNQPAYPQGGYYNRGYGGYDHN